MRFHDLQQSPLSPDTNKRKYVHCLLLLHVSNGSMYQFCLRMLKPHINRYFVLAVPAYRFRQGWWGQPLRSGQAVRYILTTSQSLWVDMDDDGVDDSVGWAQNLLFIAQQRDRILGSGLRGLQLFANSGQQPIQDHNCCCCCSQSHHHLQTAAILQTHGGQTLLQDWRATGSMVMSHVGRLYIFPFCTTIHSAQE